MSTHLFNQFKDLALNHEKEILFESAAFSAKHLRQNTPDEDHRLPYKRDVDRIVHSKAYARYFDKTQVVYLVDNDHITHRGLHVQLVSNFARGIAEILRLNLDLVEAISLGHDVGHPPFGHEGEEYLSEISLKETGKPFAHPWQSCRLFSRIEPLNLGLNVYDGFLCHDGGMQEREFFPRFGKRWEDHEKDLEDKLSNPGINISPATLEGCLVKLCDTMSYLGKDIEDALRLKVIQKDEIPKTHLGMTNREILRTLACDVIEHSFQKKYIAISQESFEALKVLRSFNFKKIYTHPKLKVESQKIQQAYAILFETIKNDFEKKGEKSFLYSNFLYNKGNDYLTQTQPVQFIIDFIAGMTDSFFVKTLNKLVIPSRIELT